MDKEQLLPEWSVLPEAAGGRQDRPSVTLRFPKIRLLMYNKIFEKGQDCVSVLIDTAYELGLVPPGSMEGATFPLQSELCGSLYLAQQIVEKHFSQGGDDVEAAGRAGRVWRAILTDVESYKETTALIHVRRRGSKPEAKECGKMAPVVFDIMLQHLQPYLK